MKITLSGNLTTSTGAPPTRPPGSERPSFTVSSRRAPFVSLRRTRDWIQRALGSAGRIALTSLISTSVTSIYFPIPGIFIRLRARSDKEPSGIKEEAKKIKEKRREKAYPRADRRIVRNLCYSCSSSSWLAKCSSWNRVLHPTCLH